MNKVPFFSSQFQDSSYGSEIREAIDRVIRKGIFILGEEVKKFEQSIAEYCGVKHVIGVGNASDGLYLSVHAAQLPKGSEVITSPYTFFASAGCLVRNDLKPVFVDIELDTFHLDLSKVAGKINSNTKAILSVDLFSHPMDYEKLNEISKKNKLIHLEDSAEAFGMKWKGKHAGTQGSAGVLSFFPTKTLGCFGDGGAVITNDDDIARGCRLGRVHGAEKKYHHNFVGINSRLDELQAAILNVKLKYVDSEIDLRKGIVKKYLAGLEGIEQVKLPFVPNDADPVWYVFAPRFEHRDNLQAYLADKGIGSFVYWPKPLHLQQCFADLGHKPGDFPNAEELCNSTLALPVFPGMSDDQVGYVIDAVKTFYKNS